MESPDTIATTTTIFTLDGGAGNGCTPARIEVCECALTSSQSDVEPSSILLPPIRGWAVIIGVSIAIAVGVRICIRNRSYTRNRSNAYAALDVPLTSTAVVQ